MVKEIACRQSHGREAEGLRFKLSDIAALDIHNAKPSPQLCCLSVKD